MKIEDYIVVFDEAMPQELCDLLIDAYDNSQDKIVRKTEIMDFEEVNILDSKDFEHLRSAVTKMMQRCQEAYAQKVQPTIWPDNLVYEAPRIKRYEPNQGIFDWHIDAYDSGSAKRLLVMFWYLNDVIDGGETVFDLKGGNLSVKPKAGRVLCFPPNFMFPHKGATPTSNAKYVISSYVQLP